MPFKTRTKPVYTRRGERNPPSVVERCLCPQVNDLEYHLWPRTGLRVCASGDMGGGLMYLRYFEAKKAEAADPRALLKTRRLVMSL